MTTTGDIATDTQPIKKGKVFKRPKAKNIIELMKEKIKKVKNEKTYKTAKQTRRPFTQIH